MKRSRLAPVSIVLTVLSVVVIVVAFALPLDALAFADVASIGMLLWLVSFGLSIAAAARSARSSMALVALALPLVSCFPVFLMIYIGTSRIL